MARSESLPDVSKLYTLILLVTAVATLYLASEVLIPLALATLLTFILAPSVTRLERLRLGRIPSVLIVVSAAFVLMLLLGWAVANQMVSLGQELPRYEKNFIARIDALKQRQNSMVDRVESVFKRLNREINETEKKSDSKTSDAAAAIRPAEEPPEVKPIPVQIVDTTPTGVGLVRNLLPEAFGFLGTLGVIIVFLIFMLLSRDDLRNRLIRLIGPDQITVTTQALDDAGRRVSKYLQAQLIINFSYGVMMALGLFLVGLPSALLLGLLGGILRYVPYVGPWAGAGLGVLLSVAESPPGDWTQPMIVVAMYVVAELVVNNVMEPWLYQSSTGISTVGVILAAVFWTWLWGALGLVLSVPLTVCIVVLGRYVPQLEFLHVMLSDADVLPPGAHLYQRLLVSDEEESRSLVETYLADHSVDELFEHVLLPALTLIEQDTYRDMLDEDRRNYILENIEDLLDELPVLLLASKRAEADEKVPAEEVAVPSAASHSIVILPARDFADELAGDMLAHLLKQRQIEATVFSRKLLFGEALEQITQASSPLIIISAVPPHAVRHARQVTKRLRHRLSGVRILVGIWSAQPHSERTESRLTSAGSDRVLQNFSQAIELIERQALGRPSRGDAADIVPLQAT
jgi:predicted PurR-regulated permease PerM